MAVSTYMSMDNALWFIAFAMLLLAFLWLLPKRRPHSLTQRINTQLAQAKLPNITAVELPDGIGGISDVARLIQTPQGLVVLERLEAEGRVFGAAQIDLWTQVSNGRSVKFKNPLYDLADMQQVVRNLVPSVPVHGVIVLGDAAIFENSAPAGVTTLANLHQTLEELPQKNLTEALSEQAWQRILRIARKDGKALTEKDVM